MQAVRLATPMPVDRIPGFAEGIVSVQDAGAQRAAQLLDVRDGMRVLDACAAPGGKTGHILELADVELIALESDAERATRIGQNLSRLKLEARIEVGDAGDPSTWFDGQPFDRILTNVPCSALGIVRRHPDITLAAPAIGYRRARRGATAHPERAVAAGRQRRRTALCDVLDLSRGGRRTGPLVWKGA